jgi:hypothetical protein
MKPQTRHSEITLAIADPLLVINANDFVDTQHIHLVEITSTHPSPP